MLHSILHVACFLILALNMLGYHDIILRMHNPNNVTFVIWQADQFSTFDPSTLAQQNWNMDNVDNMDYKKFIKELAKYVNVHNKSSDGIYDQSKSSTLQKLTLNSGDLNNQDVKKLFNKLVDHFVVLNNSLMKKTDDIAANILMFKEHEKTINLLPANITSSQTQDVDDFSNDNNFVKKVEIPIVNFKKVAVIEFLVEEDIPAIIKFLQYFSKDEMPSVKKYLDYVSRDKFAASEGHETIHLRSRRFWSAAIFTSLAIMACIALWGERHYLFKRNMLVESNRCIASRISAIDKIMQKAKDLQEHRAEKISSNEEDKIIGTIRHKLVTFQNYIKNKIMDEEKVMELNRKCCLHEQNIQHVLELMNTLRKRQEECLKVDNHVKECLEGNLEQLKLIILREKVSAFDHDRYISNLSDAIVKIEEKCCIEEDPTLKSRLNDQVLSMKKTLNKLLSKDSIQAASREIREEPAFERDHTDEDYKKAVSTPDSYTSTENQIRFQERCSAQLRTYSTKERQQYTSTKDDEKDTETFSSQDELMKGVIGDNWTLNENSCSHTTNVPKSNLRFIGGIWYLDGKQWYPSLKESTSSTSTELQTDGACSNTSC